MPLSSVTAAVMYQLVVRKLPCTPSTTMVNSSLGAMSCGSKLAAPPSFRTVSYTHLVKVFQQTVYSFKSFHAAILSYRDLASGYAMMCRMPYTLLTVVLNAMFLLLMPLGMVLIGGAAEGWAVLADLVFYIFFAPQLAFMMERLMYAVNAQMEAAEAVNKLEAILKESPLYLHRVPVLQARKILHFRHQGSMPALHRVPSADLFL